MIRKDNQTGRRGSRRLQAWRRKSSDPGGVPCTVTIVGDNPERHALASKLAARTGGRRSRNRLKFGSHLACDHFKKSRTIHSDGLPIVARIVQRHKLPLFVDGTSRGSSIVVIKGEVIKALC